jgi:hypothetical protein
MTFCMLKLYYKEKLNKSKEKLLRNQKNITISLYIQFFIRLQRSYNIFNTITNFIKIFFILDDLYLITIVRVEN